MDQCPPHPHLRPKSNLCFAGWKNDELRLQGMSVMFLITRNMIGCTSIVCDFFAVGCATNSGIKLPEKFFSRTDWHARLEKVSISDATKVIIAAYMKAIEGLSSAEDALEAKVIAIGDERIKRLESIPGIGKLSSRTLLGGLDRSQPF